MLIESIKKEYWIISEKYPHEVGQISQQLSNIGDVVEKLGLTFSERTLLANNLYDEVIESIKTSKHYQVCEE